MLYPPVGWRPKEGRWAHHLHFHMGYGTHCCQNICKNKMVSVVISSCVSYAASVSWHPQLRNGGWIFYWWKVLVHPLAAQGHLIICAEVQIWWTVYSGFMVSLPICQLADTKSRLMSHLVDCNDRCKLSWVFMSRLSKRCCWCNWKGRSLADLMTSVWLDSLARRLQWDDKSAS